MIISHIYEYTELIVAMTTVRGARRGCTYPREPKAASQMGGKLVKYLMILRVIGSLVRKSIAQVSWTLHCRIRSLINIERQHQQIKKIVEIMRVYVSGHFYGVLTRMEYLQAWQQESLLHCDNHCLHHFYIIPNITPPLLYPHLLRFLKVSKVHRPP